MDAMFERLVGRLVGLDTKSHEPGLHLIWAHPSVLKAKSRKVPSV